MSRFYPTYFGFAVGAAICLSASMGRAQPSQEPDVAPCRDCATIVPTTGAKLYRVESGLFQLQENQVVDLTDRKVIFKFTFIWKGKPNLYLHFNGRSRQVDSGQRVHLGKVVGLAETFSDRKECYIDYVKSAQPRGRPGIAVFRLQCI